MNDAKPSAAPGFAILGCFITGISALVYSFVNEEVLGLFAALLAFGIVVVVCFKK